MTDYLGYTAGEYAVDAPATALHFQRWFQNWEAGFEGAPGAPGLQFRTLAAVSAGGVIKVQRAGAVNGGSSPNTFVDVLSAVFLNSGTLRASGAFWTGSSYESARARFVRIRGGVETIVADLAGITNAGVVLTADIPFLPHDRITIRSGRTSGAGAVPVDASNTAFSTSGGDLWVLDKTTQAELLNMSRGS